MKTVLKVRDAKVPKDETREYEFYLSPDVDGGVQVRCCVGGDDIVLSFFYVKSDNKVGLSFTGRNDPKYFKVDDCGRIGHAL